LDSEEVDLRTKDHNEKHKNNLEEEKGLLEKDKDISPFKGEDDLFAINS
jgi:hypothetical protein